MALVSKPCCISKVRVLDLKTLQYSTNSTTFGVATVGSFHPGFPGAAIPFCRNFERILETVWCKRWSLEHISLFRYPNNQREITFSFFETEVMLLAIAVNSQYSNIKPFAQAANWNFNCNLLGANCQSKYQHCLTILPSGAQTNNRFHCNEGKLKKTTDYSISVFIAFNDQQVTSLKSITSCLY